MPPVVPFLLNALHCRLSMAAILVKMSTSDDVRGLSVCIAFVRCERERGAARRRAVAIL
jgi:hypothetical protein